MPGHDPLALPPDLPVPEDDGGAVHLPGARVPSVPLRATTGQLVDLAAVPGRVTVFAYPRTGVPGEPPGSDWDAIPGARGCTPELCGVRDEIHAFAALGVTVFGLSAQTPDAQHEAAARLRLPYPLLSDADAAFARALGLPTFVWRGTTLLRRLTLLTSGGVVEDAIYPVFPPDEAAAEALRRLVRLPSGSACTSRT